MCVYMCLCVPTWVCVNMCVAVCSMYLCVCMCLYMCMHVVCVLCMCVYVVKVGAGKALCFCVTPWIHLEPTGKLLSPQTLLCGRNTTKWPWLVYRISFFFMLFFTFPTGSITTDMCKAPPRPLLAAPPFPCHWPHNAMVSGSVSCFFLCNECVYCRLLQALPVLVMDTEEPHSECPGGNIPARVPSFGSRLAGLKDILGWRICRSPARVPCSRLHTPQDGASWNLPSLPKPCTSSFPILPV